MGVLNVTPDSFSDGGLFQTIDSALARVAEMVSEGADVIDIGGESTRPGSVQPSTQEELDRVLPVLEAVQAEFDCPISIDTSTPALMIEAVSRGVALINDVRALTRPGADEAVGSEAFIVLMHMQGTPRNMQKNPAYEDVVADVKSFFKERIKACASVGIRPEAITLDPGFGFGKNLGHNIALLKNLSEFHEFGVSILAGLSRKSMIGALLGDKGVDDRMIGSVTAALVAAENGANIIRAHDVVETKDALTVWQQIKDFRE